MSYSTIAPILRGALRRGDIGPIVRKTDTEVGDRALSIGVDLSSDDGSKAKIIFNEINKFEKEKGHLPSSVEIPGDGVYLIINSGSLGVKSGRIAGRIALVTGGAQGFGEEIVRHLVSEGALVYIADLNLEKGIELAAELNDAAGGEVVWPLKVDVTDEGSIEELLGELVKNTGGLDLFVNNAGVLRAGSVKTLSKKDFDFVTSVNYSAYFLGVKHFSSLMALQNLADRSYVTDIIQINSKSGLEGSNKNGAYAGGKFGGIGLTQSFALELIEDNIKVNAICPGNFFDGPLWSDPKNGLFVQYLNSGKVPGAKTVDDVKAFYEAKVPMGRGCTGIDVARAIYYAVEQKYETGQAIPVTGGQIMLK